MHLIVYAEATREFYDKDPSDSAHPKYATLREVTNIASGVDREGNAGNPRVTVSLANEAGQTKRRFLTPPIGFRAELYDGEELTFAGTVDFVRCVERYELQVQA